MSYRGIKYPDASAYLCFRSAYPWKVALFINQSEHVARFPSQKVQDLLVVAELDVIPHDPLLLVLFLLQLEDVVHEELLQLLVGEIYAKLLKAVKIKTCLRWGFF